MPTYDIDGIQVDFPYQVRGQVIGFLREGVSWGVGTSKTLGKLRSFWE